MINLELYLVTYDRLYDKVIEQLDENELQLVKCYGIQKGVKKEISDKIIDVVNEWELPNNDYSFQQKQYYEYSSIVHLVMNPHLLDNLTHIGILHYDIIFEKDSINDILYSLEKNPDKIFYQRILDNRALYMSKYELDNITNFMSEKLNIEIDSNKIWNNGWISEALSVTPVDVFKKFGNFIIEYHTDIEDILLKNRWGIMNIINHRICGIVERMWGIYLVSLEKELVKMNIIHDWDSYIHKHCSEENWIKK